MSKFVYAELPKPVVCKDAINFSESHSLNVTF